MRKYIIFLLTFVLSPAFAGITTYTFTSEKWKSEIDATPCDGTTDGWVCDSAANSYDKGRNDAQGRLYSSGVGVITGTSTAGATSILEFTDIRRITVNFCQNNKKGKGAIYVQVGTNEPQSIVVNKPASSGGGVYNRDSIINFTTPQSGKIKFWVECTENAIYINTISIRSASGGSSVFTMDTYQLVTDVAQLQDSDQVIFGVAQNGVNYIMGYFDEDVSSNNIHAIPGKYSADRSTVNADDRAIYTLRITELNGETAYIFQDELRYEEAYLVASGGQTKNRLALWTNLVDPYTYGNYGYWTIAIEDGHKAVITNLGNSKGKIIQYNASNSPTLFACYADRSQTDVCLYRRVEAMGDVEAIVAPFVNFGTTIETSGARTVMINANKLTADISVSLKNGQLFSVSTDVLDRDGDYLTISYNTAVAGHYIDTLILESGSVRTEVEVRLQLLQPLSIAQAVQSEDYAMVYLNDVVVTKKYDTYIYIRDETGAMLLFDRGNGETGKPYGQDLKAGDPLSGVAGRFINYFGVPEISPTEQFSKGTNSTILPEAAPALIDSADVCRYLLLDSAVMSGNNLTYKGQAYAVTNKFNLSGFIENIPTRITCIVSYDRDVVTLYIVSQDTYPTVGIENPTGNNKNNRLVMRDGVLLVETEKGLFTLEGKKIF